MTLTPFPPNALDELALRLLDVATLVRRMANSARESGVQDFHLHGNKAHEWLDNLEQWTYEAAGRLDAKSCASEGWRRGLGGNVATAKSGRGPRRKPRK